MLKIKHILFFILSIQVYSVSSQDMQYTQFYSAPLYLNPAFTGANVCGRVSLIYRNQWPGIKKTYTSYMLTADHFFVKQKIGAGILCAVDEAGSGDLRTTMINPSFAYETKITNNFAIRAGLQPGVTIKSINFNKLIFGDQLSKGNKNSTTIEAPTQNKTFIDIGAGILCYTNKFWGGASFFHLNRPNESFFGMDDIRLPIKYSVHGGTKFALNPDERDPSLKRTITTAVHYRGQNEFDQFDIGFYYSQNIFNIGIWYRGIPGLKAYKPGYSNNDAIATIIGLQTPRMNIGYSYDMTISQLTGLSKGAHEITLSYQLCKLKTKTKRVVISCPKF